MLHSDAGTGIIIHEDIIIIIEVKAMKKRLISLVLCAIMLTAVLPACMTAVGAAGGDGVHKTENVSVPGGWDYIEVSTAKELEDALNKHSWTENNSNPQSCFIRLTADISITSVSVSTEKPALIYANITVPTTIDFNGHTLSGALMAEDDVRNKTWALLNLCLQYGCVPDLTLRLVDSVGTGGVNYVSRTFFDAPASGISIHGIYIREVSENIPAERAPYTDSIPNVIIDGGNYKMYSKTEGFVDTRALMGELAPVNEYGEIVWDWRTPYTRSAVGITGCRATVNDGHFTGTCYCYDNMWTNHCRKFVSALGLGDSTAVANLRINGGKFDGDAYAVYFYSGEIKDADLIPIPVLNGGSYSGGINLCPTWYSYWNGINGNWELNEKNKNWSADIVLPKNAVMYMDGKPIDSKTTLEDLARPHEITIDSAPCITEARAKNTQVLTGRGVNIYVRFNKVPDSVFAEEYIVTLRNGKEFPVWNKISGKYYLMPNESKYYWVEIPAKSEPKKSQIRITAQFGDIYVTSDTYEIEWVYTPEFAFTVQPHVVTASAGSPAYVTFNFNYPDMLKEFTLWRDVNRSYYTLETGYGSVPPEGTDDGNYHILFTDLYGTGADESTYIIFLDYDTGTDETVRIESNEFTVNRTMLDSSHQHAWPSKWDYSDENGHAYFCTSCGALSDIHPHNPGPEATSTAPQTCLDCGYVIKPATGETVGVGNALEGVSSWALDEVKEAIAVGLVPQELQKNYTSPVTRGEVAGLVIRLLEMSSGKSIQDLMNDKNVVPDNTVFTDTSDYDVFCANALGIINGTGWKQFSPNGSLKRAQITAIVNRIAGVMGFATEGYTHGFTDITGNYAWADPELGWSVHNGIIKGVGGNKFNPGGDLTVEQVILIAYRAYNVLK